MDVDTLPVKEEVETPFGDFSVRAEAAEGTISITLCTVVSSGRLGGTLSRIPRLQHGQKPGTERLDRASERMTPYFRL